MESSDNRIRYNGACESSSLKETYHWLRHKGICEVDIPKILGGKRQYYHKLRKQDGSSEFELFETEGQSVFASL